MKNKSNVVSHGPYVFYALISDIHEKEFYFTGTYDTAEQFKNKIKSYYATEIDVVDAYTLRFNYISNIGKIDGVDDGKYINV